MFISQHKGFPTSHYSAISEMYISLHQSFHTSHYWVIMLITTPGISYTSLLWDTMNVHFPALELPSKSLLRDIWNAHFHTTTSLHWEISLKCSFPYTRASTQIITEDIYLMFISPILGFHTSRYYISLHYSFHTNHYWEIYLMFISLHQSFLTSHYWEVS